MAQASDPRITWLKKEINESIERFSAEADKHKKLYRRLRYGYFALGALSTVLAGVAAATRRFEEIPNLLVICTTASGSFLVAIEGVRKPGDLWRIERRTQHALRDLLREVRYGEEVCLGQAKIDEWFHRMQAILQQAGQWWLQSLQAPPNPAATGSSPGSHAGGTENASDHS